VAISRSLASGGVRLALVQTAILLGAFAVAGALARPVIHRVIFDSAETHVRAEAAALRSEFQAGGRARMAASIAARTRRADGVYYRLDGADGQFLAGSLPTVPEHLGLSFIDGDDSPAIANPILRQDIVVYAERLPNGDVITAAEALGARAQLQRILRRDLLWCGLLAAGGGLVASLLIYGGVVRRIDALVAVAREAGRGQLDARVPARKSLLPDDIDALSAAVNHMLERIAILMREVRQVSVDIAHDLRTPLTRVGQKLDALRRRPPGQPILPEDIQRIQDDLAEALRTFDAMLRLAEIESHALARPERFDLADIAAQVAEAYLPDVEEADRSLDARLASALLTGDRDLITQALANLLDNAIRHTPPHTRIVLATGTEDGRPYLSVQDNGPGVPEADRAAVLQRFVRLDPSRTGRGAGLGLAIVAAVAQRHNATLELVDAAPGLHVRIRFPAPVIGGASPPQAEPPKGSKRPETLAT
jgi:signal transduction histidine kinase